MDDEQNIVEIEEVNEPLLTITNTEQNSRLRSISTSDDEESESAEIINISQCSLFFQLAFAIFIMVVSIAFFSLIIWITPTPPTVHVHSMKLSFADKILVWSATFSIINPNEKLHVTYKNPSVRILCRIKLVSMGIADSFEQKGGEEKEMVLVGDETRVVNDEAACDMEKEVAVITGGIVGFNIVFEATVGFYPLTSTLWGEQNITAVSENVRATLMSNVDDDKINGTNRSVLSSDGRLDCRVRLPLYP